MMQYLGKTCGVCNMIQPQELMSIQIRTKCSLRTVHFRDLQPQSNVPRKFRLYTQISQQQSSRTMREVQAYQVHGIDSASSSPRQHRESQHQVSRTGIMKFNHLYSRPKDHNDKNTVPSATTAFATSILLLCKDSLPLKLHITPNPPLPYPGPPDSSSSQ